MLARPHLSIAPARRTAVTKPDPALLEGVVAEPVLEAMRRASAALRRAGIRHVVAGGLAVGANGFPRATKDVKFLVGSEAFEHHEGGLVTLRAGVPFQVNQVAIDFLEPQPGEDFLAAALSAEPGSILEAAPLVFMKLKARRLKDRVDVVELIKAGLDVEACRDYLAAHAPEHVRAFDEAVAQAREEDE
jgi:hypothetical protein